VIQRIILFLLLVSFSGVGCSTLMKPEDISGLKSLEKDRYQLKTDVYNNGMLVLKNGMYVNIFIQNSPSWIKVYARRSDEELLKSERFLLIYMFDEDFKDNMFDRTVFDKRFFDLVKVVSGNDPKAKADAKPGAQQKPNAPAKPVNKK
jgi:type II secretion system-associated lipoprotein